MSSSRKIVQYVNFNGNDFDMKMDKKEMDDVSKVYYKLYWCIYELGLWCTIEVQLLLGAAFSHFVRCI